MNVVKATPGLKPGLNQAGCGAEAPLFTGSEEEGQSQQRVPPFNGYESLKSIMTGAERNQFVLYPT